MVSVCHYIFLNTVLHNCLPLKKCFFKKVTINLHMEKRMEKRSLKKRPASTTASTNFLAVCFFPRLIFWWFGNNGEELGNNGEERGRREGREGVKSDAWIWGLSRASEAALVTHLDGLRGLTPAPNRGAATDCCLGSKPPGLFSGQGFYQAAGGRVVGTAS